MRYSARTDYFSFSSGYPALGTLPGPQFSKRLQMKEQRKEAATNAAVVLGCLKEDNIELSC